MASTEPIRRLGILGGTFNPPHMAHLAMACAAKEAMGLDLVLLVTDGDPPHKLIEVPAQTRHAMVALATKSYDGICASDVEICRPGRSYTVDTLKYLKEQYPDARLYFIIGGDMLEGLPYWRGAAEIFRLADIVAVPRRRVPWMDQAATYLKERCGAMLTLLPDAVEDISSTRVRACIHDALPAGDMLLPAVEAYIYEAGLYFPPEIRSIQNEVRAACSPRQYAHAMAVVQTVVRLAARHGINGPQARLAALLYAKEPGDAAICAMLSKNEGGIADETAMPQDELYKLVCIADKIESGRNYPGVEALRALADTDLNAAFFQALQS